MDARLRPRTAAALAAALLVGALALAPPPPASARQAGPETAQTGVVQVSSGGDTVCVLLDTGHVKCVGNGDEGELGNGTSSDSQTPVFVSNVAGTGPLGGVVQISVGYLHACARLQNGSAVCWGDNTTGQLGDGSTAEADWPVRVRKAAGSGFLGGVQEIIASSGFHTCARIANTEVRCWGENTFGQLGDASTNEHHRPVTVKSVTGSGRLSNVVQLDLGESHTCARLESAEVRCWGYNTYGQLGIGSDQERHRPVIVKNATNSGHLGGVRRILLGDNHSCAVLQNGQVRCWGKNEYGQIGDGTSDTDRELPRIVKAVSGPGALQHIVGGSAGSNHTCVVTDTDHVDCWGDNGSYQNGHALTPPENHVPVVVRNMVDTGPLGGVSHVATGDDNGCARLNNGQVRCWGYNFDYELSNGSNAATFPATVWAA